jgi:hypothetical protein
VLAMVLVVLSIFDCGFPPTSVLERVHGQPAARLFSTGRRDPCCWRTHDPSWKKSRRPNPRNGPPSPPMNPMPKPGPRPNDQRPPGHRTTPVEGRLEWSVRFNRGEAAVQVGEAGGHRRERRRRVQQHGASARSTGFATRRGNDRRRRRRWV